MNQTAIVVTGAASGMGRACVERSRQMADIVFAVDLQPPRIDGVIALGYDIADPSAGAALAQQVSDAGQFRGLIHAAGLSPTMASARRVMQVNLVGTQLLLNAFEPLVVAGSAAVCFASNAAHRFGPYATAEQMALIDDPLASDFLDKVDALVPNSGIAYGLSKVGVINAARRASALWCRRGGRVNSLSPGSIDTPMGRLELDNQPMMRRMLETSPRRELADPAEVAAVAAFLISDESSFVCGIDVLVDGGEAAAEVAARPRRA